MADDILYNSPALHALKRQQLVSLSKRYGLRASGKNEEIIDRLKEFASTLTPSRKNGDPTTVSTPGLGNFATESIPRARPDFASHSSRPSDTWEVLSESNASIISPDKRDLSKSGSVSSWKSAGNGESLSESGEDGPNVAKSKSSRTSSMKAFADMTRRASVHLLSRSHSSSSAPVADLQPIQTEEPVPQESMEVVKDPPSPASTVGVARRHSTISLLERPSTLRLVSPPPPENTGDNLPFSGGTTNLRMMKERRSMAPLRAQSSATTALNRKSMPALPSSSSASVPSIYPSLQGRSGRVEEHAPAPFGPFEPTKTIQHKESIISISNEQFEDAGKRVLAEMEAKMKAHLGDRAESFGQELLKGKSADLGTLVRVNSSVGASGWGLAGEAGAKKDRYAEAHAREFKRMRSIDQGRKPSGGRPPTSVSTVALPTIAGTPATKRKFSNMPSAPNGAPLEPTEAQGAAKRKRLSFGPNAMGSLRGAGKSLVNVIGDIGVTPRKPPVSAKKPIRKRRSSITAGKGRGLASRFGFFNRKRQSVERTAATRVVSNPKSLAPVTRHPSTVQRDRIPSGATSRKPSTTSRKASTNASITSSSRIRARPRLPDFGAASSTSGSVNSLGLPQAGTVSSTLSARKQSHADIIRKARPAPAPPASTSVNFGSIELDASGALKRPNLGASVSSVNKRSSTLLQPTASSKARMQATLKPNLDRPLPAVPKPKLATTKPFGQGSSRDDSTFDMSFNVPKPSHPPSAYSSPPQALTRTRSTATFGERTTPKGPRAPLRSNTMMNLKSPGKSPGKTSSIAGKRARDKAGGMSSIKARGGQREMEGAQKRAEMKAKQERLGEERELREMLGGVGTTS